VAPSRRYVATLRGTSGNRTSSIEALRAPLAGSAAGDLTAVDNVDTARRVRSADTSAGFVPVRSAGH
jgi:hypothetical protein